VIHPSKQRRSPFPFHFFVADQQKGNVGIYRATVKIAPTLQHILHPNHVGGNDGFHVRGAAAPEIVAFDARGELGVVGVGFDNVEVASY
jgi:hypothetical protein